MAIFLSVSGRPVLHAGSPRFVLAVYMFAWSAIRIGGMAVRSHMM